MEKKRFSIFNLDEEYIPRSVWNAGFGELGEMQEEPLYTTEENNPQNGVWNALDRPQKGDVNTQPNNWFDDHRDDDHQYKDTPRLILYADKKSTQPDNFPRRKNNILKAVHQRIVNSNNPASVRPASTSANEIPSYGALGKRTGQEAVRHLDEMASSPELGYDRNKTGTLQPLPGGNSQAIQPDNFPRRENNLLKALHQRITNKNMEVPVQRADTVNDTLKTNNGVLPGKATHSLPQSSRGYIDAPGMPVKKINGFLANMTPAQKDSIDRVYNGYAKDARRDLQKLSGERINPVKAVIFDPDTTHVGGAIQYKNDTITAKWNFLNNGENLKRSQMLHEMQHHADKDKLPFRWGDSQNGKVVYNEQTSYPGVPIFKNPDPVYTNEEKKKWQYQEDMLRRFTENTYRSEGNKFTYTPSNYIQAEINALYSQLEAHLRGLTSISEENMHDILLNLETRKAGLKKALDYEKEKRYAPTGYPFEK